jgi:membrane protein DedA with SNARE-associated domain
MKFLPFTLSTLLGSFAWSYVLARFGQEVLGSDPQLLTDPDALMHALKAKLAWLVIGALLLLAGYVAVDLLGRRWRRADARG